MSISSWRKPLKRYLLRKRSHRVMCLMQMGALSHETVMKSIRNTGEYLIPRLAG
jgi:hypothetical protein